MSLRTILRKPFANSPYAEDADLAGKHAIVTGCGANSLGYETAKTLARWGALVAVTNRRNSEATAQQLIAELAIEGVTAKVVGQDLDLTEADSVNTFADWYVAEHGERLDILVNNAGVHLDLMSEWKTPTLTDDGFEIQWRINYLGTVHLTHKLLPLLKQTGTAQGDVRVVNVVSQIHKKGSNTVLFDADAAYSSWQSYGLSKLGAIHFARELHRRFGEEFNLKAYSLHPGAAAGTSSDVANKGFEGHAVINFMRKLSEPLMNVIMTNVEEGAQTQLYCATAADAQSGGYFQDCILNEAKASDDSRDAKAAQRLWDETQPWLDKVSG